MRVNRLLLDAGVNDPGAGGGNTFLATLPEDIRTDPTLANIKDLPTLAKGYVNAQHLIGSKRVAIPGEKATDQEWGAFYDAAGRPATPDKYELPKLELEPEVQIDDKQKDEVFKKLHSLGLTNRQAQGVLEMHLNTLNDGVKQTKTATANSSSAAESALKQEWGDKFTANVDIAKAAIKKFGGDGAGEVIDFLNKSGLGNNVPLIRLFHKIGLTVQEDVQRQGGGTGLELTDQTRALQEIESLKTDKLFQEAYGNASNPGHKGAVERWLRLHQVAHPGKQD